MGAARVRLEPKKRASGDFGATDREYVRFHVASHVRALPRAQIGGRRLAKASASPYRSRMRSISIKAIILATLAVFGIDFVSGMVLMGVFGDLPASATEEQVRAAAAALARNPGYLRAALILGTASTVVGGYLVTRLAHSVPYFNALAFGVLGIVLGALVPTDLPLWFTIVGLGLTIPAALLGAYVGKRRAGASAG
jgi:hypothetical protein